MQEEVERLKQQYSTGSQSAATALHLMEKNLSDEQAKDKDLIAKLTADLEAKEAAISELTASQVESVVADVESKVDQYHRESIQALDDNKRDLASMSSSFEKEKAARDSENAQFDILESQAENLQDELSKKQMKSNIQQAAFSQTSPGDALARQQGQVVGSAFSSRRKN